MSELTKKTKLSFTEKLDMIMAYLDNVKCPVVTPYSIAEYTGLSYQQVTRTLNTQWQVQLSYPDTHSQLIGYVGSHWQTYWWSLARIKPPLGKYTSIASTYPSWEVAVVNEEEQLDWLRDTFGDDDDDN